MCRINIVTTCIKRPFCIIFMLKKPYLKVQNLQYKFLDWKWPPPPFGTFPKIHPFWRCHPSLTWSSCAEFLAHPMSPYWEWHHVTWSWALPHFLLPGKSWRCTRKHMVHSLSGGLSRGRLAKSENATNQDAASGKNHNLSTVLSERHVEASDRGAF